MMREFVAVRSCYEQGNFAIKNWFSSQYSASLKNQALLFDRIGIVNLETYLIPVRIMDAENQHLLNLEYLQEKGIVFDYNVQRTWRDAEKLIRFFLSLKEQGLGDYPLKVNNAQLEKINATAEFVKNAQEILEEKQNKFMQLNPNNPAHSEAIIELSEKSIRETDELIDQLRERMLENDSGEVRLVAMWMAMFENSEIIPLLPYKEYLAYIPGTKKTDVVEVVIKELPIPDEQTPWEKIIEYREGQHFIEDRENLRGWITNVSYSNLPQEEIAEQLELLMKKYRKHLDNHDIKSRSGILETIIKVPVGIAIYFLNLDPEKLVNPFFDIINRRISLLDTELNAPGNEVSYIVKTQEAFA